MRFESVTCRAFGPFRNRTLSLKPGMNVIYGPNEAGKSTWRAAITAGLCGRRRGRGAPGEDRAFARRHRPWDDPKEWAVSAVVHLADGRQIELSHDLAGGVDSSARDARYANRDLSHEVMNDGAPDGAKWLGLDRRSFQSVACVRQSELLSILRDAKKLQADLQRAAATARTDATASDAVDRLQAFRSERVGTSRAHTKPLRRSEAAVEAARAARHEAQAKHALYRSRRQEIDKLEREVREGEMRVAAASAVLAEDRAAAARKRHAEARDLNDCFPSGPPRESSERNELALRIAGVLDRWRALPDTLPPSGPTVLEITEQIAASEAEENALLAARAAQDLADTERRLAQARKLVILFPDEQRPVAPAEDEDLARRVATALEKWNERPGCGAPASPSVQQLEAELHEIDVEMARLAGTGVATEVLRGAPRLGLAIFLALAVLLALAGVVSSWVALFGLLASGGWWFTRVLAKQAAIRSRQQRELVERRRRLERAITTRQLDDWQREDDLKRLRQSEQDVRRAAAAIGNAVGDLDATVEALGEWRSRRKAALGEFSQRSDDWDAFQRLLGGKSLEALVSATVELRKQVTEEAAAVSDSALSAAREQNISTDDLARFRRQAETERGRLRTALGSRREQDHTHQQRTKNREAVAAALAMVARDAGVSANEPKEQAVGFEAWQERRRKEMAAAEEKSKKWDRLQQLLGGKALDELGQIAAGLAEKARSLSASVARQALIEARKQGTTEPQFAEPRSDLEQKKRDLHRSLGEIEEFQTTLPDLAQAEEALAVANAERDRVRQLDSILAKTIDFLKDAEERIHRDLAPVLQEGVLQRLSDVTGGRYVDCRVDPETLAVDVRGRDRPWRPATNLSHGTAEQIYLLLRLTLTRHLGKPEEPCPLILDDPVGASDASRRSVLLETLLTISEECQVILFTHDVDVRKWAEQSLIGSRHQLEQLNAAGIPV